MEKRIYELTVVLGEKKTEKEAKALVEAALEKADGRLVDLNFWGKKDLIRRIGKQSTVVFVFAEVELSRDKVVELGSRLRMNDEVLRHMIVSGAEVKVKVEKGKKVSNKKKK